MKRIKCVEDYIAASEDWHRELETLRKTIMSTGLVETIKWGAPCYTHNGRNVVGMAAFRQYFGLWFHQGALLNDTNNKLINAQEGKTKALRQWRMYGAKDIQPTIITRYLHAAIANARAGRQIQAERGKSLEIPAELEQALKNSRKTARQFRSLRPGQQREYASYIAEAKRDDTKQRRLAKILPMIAKGAGLNDKYRGR